MSFRIGQDVYVHMADPSRVQPGCLKYMCSVGTISRGPFYAGELPGHDKTAYAVLIDGTEFGAAECLLEPINPPSESQTREQSREVTA